MRLQAPEEDRSFRETGTKPKACEYSGQITPCLPGQSGRKLNPVLQERPARCPAAQLHLGCQTASKSSPDLTPKFAVDVAVMLGLEMSCVQKELQKQALCFIFTLKVVRFAPCLETVIM